MSNNARVDEIICKYSALAGNSFEYSVKASEVKPASVLAGKTIIFLGSSVTYGYASMKESFVDYLAKQDGVIAYKEAASGTTLVDEDVDGRKSYIARMKNIDPSLKVDAFVCQLSTNDAKFGKPLGAVSDSYELAAFDVKTIAGAIEYIVAYARLTWACPVVFYTNVRYESEHYTMMVELLYKIQQKWEIGIIDLWNDASMNAVSEKDRKLYMADSVHPTRAGYRDWWTPKFEAYLSEFLLSHPLTENKLLARNNLMPSK